MDDFDLFEDSTSLKSSEGNGNRFEEGELRDCRTKKADNPPIKENEQICDGCGKIFLKSDLRKCNKCGAVLCPVCRIKHKCGANKKERVKKEPVKRETVKREPENVKSVKQNKGEIDYEINRKYFDDSGYGYVVFSAMGAVFILIGVFIFPYLNFEITSSIFAIIMFIIGIIMLISGIYQYNVDHKMIPTDDEMDAICKMYTDKIVKKAYTELGIDESQVNLIEPFIHNGYYFDRINDREYKERTGRNNYNRHLSSNCEIFCLFFSEEQVYNYIYRFSLINEGEISKTQNEVFYSDIVSITTTSSVGKYAYSDTKYNYEDFRIITSGNTSISTSLITTDEKDTEKLNTIIFAMKQLVRDKKYQRG